MAIRLTGSIIFSPETLQDLEGITQTKRHKRPCCSTTFFFALSQTYDGQNTIYIRDLNFIARILRMICCCFGAYHDTIFDKGSLKRIWSAYHAAISSPTADHPDAVPQRLSLTPAHR